TGPLAGVAYDGQDPAFADLYGVAWNSTDYGYEGPQDVGPPEFEKNFQDRMFDLIDKYHPDLYYTDGGPPFKTAGYNIVAHLYNESRKLNGGKLQALATFKGGGIGVENYEFEYADTIKQFVWQTDKTMSPEWYWLRDKTKDYKKANEIVHTLIDVVSKNGNLLLNVPLTAAGELEEEVITMLTGMGHDLDLIGEAVFATRSWDAFGEGPNGINGLAALTPQDIRFTRNKKRTVLYATVMGWPGDGSVVRIRTLSRNRIDLKGLQGVSLPGTTGKLKYVQDAEGLKITLPAKAPYSCSVYPIKLSFGGSIPPLKPAPQYLWDAVVRNISGIDDKNKYDLPTECGVLILDIPTNSITSRAGLQKDDVIITCNGIDVQGVGDLRGLQDKAEGRKLTLAVSRKTSIMAIDLSDYAYVVTEGGASAEFKTVKLAAASVAVPVKVSAGGAVPGNDPIEALTDGVVTNGSGPIFANGVIDGAYRLDLGGVRSIAQVNVFSSGGNRARQNFVLYGSSAPSDPGWNVADIKVFKPIISVDSRKGVRTEFEASSIRRSSGQTLGSYRWLILAVAPVNGEVGGENTAFQELQVIECGKK
ncbi:MAG: alpha-L-fucosidase, partial [bacterium]